VAVNHGPTVSKVALLCFTAASLSVCPFENSCFFPPEFLPNGHHRRRQCFSCTDRRENNGPILSKTTEPSIQSTAIHISGSFVGRYFTMRGNRWELSFMTGNVIRRAHSVLMVPDTAENGATNVPDRKALKPHQCTHSHSKDARCAEQRATISIIHLKQPHSGRKPVGYSFTFSACLGMTIIGRSQSRLRRGGPATEAIQGGNRLSRERVL